MTPPRRRADGLLVTRCAWCGRQAVADRWISADEQRRVGPAGEQTVTHGICPECVDDLRARGLSR